MVRKSWKGVIGLRVRSGVTGRRLPSKLACTGSGIRPSERQQPRRTARKHYVGLDVALKETAICIVANDRALRSSQAWTDGATRFLKDYVAESN